MAAHREEELKYRIESREDFLDLRDAPRWGARSQPARQVNHFFDTQDLSLTRQRILVRIREEGRIVLTLKRGREVSEGYFDSTEIEDLLEETVLRRVLEDPARLLALDSRAMDELRQCHGPLPLKRIGVLVNERVRRETAGLVLEVDRTEFPDGSEGWELEIETSEPGRSRLWVEREILARGLKLVPERRTKLEQMLERVHP